MSTAASGASRRTWSLVAAAVALALLLGTLAGAILTAQSQSREHLRASLQLRGSASAHLIGTYLAQQAEREQSTAQRYLASPNVSRRQFETIAYVFGSSAAVLTGADGRVIDVLPRDPSLIGVPLTSRLPAAAAVARATLSGKIGVSDLIATGTAAGGVAAIAVPFQTALVGRRVFAAAYGAGSALLSSFVNRTSTLRGHRVLLVDGAGRLLAASPATSAATLAGADRALARSVARAPDGTVSERGGSSTYVSAPVPGTAWRLIDEAPSSALYSSVGGWTFAIPWVVFALVTLLGALLLVLFARLLADRARLSALTRRLDEMARTDPLTGLLNRRGVQESLAALGARARRRGERLSVMMIDLDRFKDINDGHGHEAGDRVLRLLADCMRDVLRAEDVYGRVGGDEFLAAVAGGGREVGRRAADRLAAAPAAVDLSDLGLHDGIPLSIGIARGEPSALPDDLVREADVELYRVKESHRRAGAGARGEG